MPIQRVAGSFRDPSGFVFFREGRVFRAVDETCQGVLEGLADSGRFDDLVARRLIVDTQFVKLGELLDELRDDCPGVDHFLEHEVIPTITYPYEWSVSMLADAGIHTIDLQLELLKDGCALKDATAYNIQFVEGRPQMIDVASIERPQRQDVWFAYGQFLQMFLYPLLLNRYQHWDLHSDFLGKINGRDIESVGRAFSWWQKLRPGLFLDVTMPLWLHRWAEKGRRAQRETLEKPADNTRAQVLNLQRMRRKLRKLADSYRPSGVWTDYTNICNYDGEAELAKKGAVCKFLMQSNPRQVLDLGCNTGEYSRLAAECGAEVLAADADHDAIEMLYRGLKDRPANITPVVLDLANPSPAIGFMNLERPAFAQRAKADCVLALALMHHLLVSANMPLAGVCDLLHSLTERDLVLEFVPPEDEMFQRLMKFRVDLFQDLTLAQCKAAFAKRFEIREEVAIANSQRTLLFMRKV